MSSEPQPFTPDPYEPTIQVPEAVLKSGLSRRGMLQMMGLMGGSAVLAGTGVSALAGAVGGARAAAADPNYVLPSGFKGDITDLKHVVILIQENRSFDHYYGALPGVRGLNDKQALQFQNGNSVFQQPNGSSFVKPNHVTTVAGMTTGLDHSYSGGLSAWATGKYNNWIGAKGSATMNYLTGGEIPWQWSLANAYTICDSWHCSLMGPTTPNRLYHWTGTSNGVTGNGGETNGTRAWQTYPEALQAAGVSWRIFVDNTDSGSTWRGDYTDNPIRGFATFTTSGSTSTDKANLNDPVKTAPGTGLVWRANSFPYGPTYIPGTTTQVPNNDSDSNLNGVLQDFIAACKPDAQFPLPQVSWIVSPYEWSEHPSAEPEHGAHYSNRVIQALQANPDLWKSTLLIMTFDENDGYFDHALPPYPEPGTPGEYTGSTPFGYGARVPSLLVSPWTRGGWVSTEVCDHTSTLQFLEQWTTALGTPALCTQISSWRRGISGNLLSAMDFAHPVVDTPSLPDTATLVAIADKGGTVQTQLPSNEQWNTGVTMQHRPLSFHPHGTFTEDRNAGTVTANLSLVGGPDGKAVSLQVFPDRLLAFSNTPYTVSAKAPKSYKWNAAATGGQYAFSVYGPDGFVRSHAGTVLRAGQNNAGVPKADVALVAGTTPSLTITLGNDGHQQVKYTLVANDYLGGTQTVYVNFGEVKTITWPTSEGYYDVVITADTGTGWRHRYAGRVAQISES